jgi:N-methylhydantoinase B
LRNPDSNREINLGNTDVVAIDPGDVIRITSAGAGGWGSPLEREPERVARDVDRGFVTRGAAEAEYGVVLVDNAVDEQATTQLRKKLHAANGHRGFGYHPAQIEFERIWTRENYATLSTILLTLPIDWRFFVKHKIFEALETMTEDELTGGGEEVRAAFRNVATKYADLAEFARGV